MSKGSHRRHAGEAREAAPSGVPDQHDHDHHGGGHRHPRLQQLLHEELSALLRDEISDPALEGVTFTGVELSVDYKHARVHFVTSPGGDRARSERALARATPFLRARLADAVELKQVPALRFLFDADAVRYGDGEEGTG